MCVSSLCSATHLLFNTELRLRSADNSTIPDWAALFDPSPDSLLKLLYSLKIVDRLLDSSADQKASPAAKAQVNKWIEVRCCSYLTLCRLNNGSALRCEQVFLTQGGFAHLYRIIMGMDLKRAFADTLPTQCLAAVLKLFNTSMTWISSGVEQIVKCASTSNTLCWILTAFCCCQLPRSGGAPAADHRLVCARRLRCDSRASATSR